MKLLAAALALPLLAAPLLPAHAAGDAWSEREICRAAIKTFFLLPELPTDDAAADFRDHMGFQGRNGIVTRQYACRVQEDRVAIRWFKENGDRKRDANTRWAREGDALVIRTQMDEARYAPR